LLLLFYLHFISSSLCFLIWTVSSLRAVAQVHNTNAILGGQAGATALWERSVELIEL
jgi:hypothetical protein